MRGFDVGTRVYVFSKQRAGYVQREPHDDPRTGEPRQLVMLVGDERSAPVMASISPRDMVPDAARSAGAVLPFRGCVS